MTPHASTSRRPNARVYWLNISMAVAVAVGAACMIGTAFAQGSSQSPSSQPQDQPPASSPSPSSPSMPDQATPSSQDQNGNMQNNNETMPSHSSANKSGSHSEDTRIARTVKHEIMKNSETRHATINVSAHDGVVTLTGKAKSQSVAETAEKIARSTSGVKDVEDKIQVASAGNNNTNEPGSNQQQNPPPTQP